MSVQFRTEYFDEATQGLRSIIDEAKGALADVDFDTFVGTGFSGGVVIPALALEMGKDYTLIRKEDDDSHHGGGRMVGSLGSRWIFLDDFISLGNTRRRVVDKVAAACVMYDHTTTYVGQYLYGRHVEQKFIPFDGDWDSIKNYGIY